MNQLSSASEPKLKSKFSKKKSAISTMKVFIWLAVILFCGTVAVHSAPFGTGADFDEQEIDFMDKEEEEVEIAESNNAQEEIDEPKNSEEPNNTEASNESSEERKCGLKDRIVGFFTGECGNGKGKADVSVSHENGSTEVKAEVGKRWESDDGKTKIEANVHVDGKFNGGEGSSPSSPNYGASIQIETEW